MKPQVREVKLKLWNNFAKAHQIEVQAVPLFDIQDGQVTVLPYGRNGRQVLKRSTEMEALMRDLGNTLIEQYGNCLLYTSPSPRDRQKSRMPSSA